MELPVLLLTNGVLLPNAKLKVPVKSKTNLATLDRFVLNKGLPGKSLILVAYRMEKEKYTIHLVGVSRAKIEKFAIPVSTVQQLYAIEEVLDMDIRQTIRELSAAS
ncbi:hypothetical protein NECAME_14982 [Necator americanus]|uniref:Lon N-terminal domain-containing protein n=1 Tax=Necator americanus TaxID=51031 RepID=W2SK17_NECAM|nr:hypothetical protein NECAME_14982 [Necator americanus]ETN69950.1 hypothetical protein NECAME_14982 [Necator americanus]